MADQGTKWMYQSQNDVDTEAYLTGKKIDKAFEKFLDAQLKTERENRLAGVTATGEKEADLYNKKLEDPLTIIKNHEKSAKERLKANPKKMKILRNIFDQMMEEKKNAKKRAKMIKKEAKRKRKYSGNSDESGGDDDDRNQKNQPDAFEKYRQENKMTRDIGFKKDNESWNADRFKVGYGHKLIYGHRDERYTDKSRADIYNNSKHVPRSDNDGSHKMESKIESQPPIKIKKFEAYSREQSFRNRYENKPGSVSSTGNMRKEEKKPRNKDMGKKSREAKLAAMMSDAKTLETKRKEKSAKLDSLQKKQDEEDRKNLGKGSGFMKEFKNDCSNATLEERINMRKHRQQRTSNDLSKNSFRR